MDNQPPAKGLKGKFIMLHQQNQLALFELSREQHGRLLQEADQHRLLSVCKPAATPSSLLLRWLRGQTQAPEIHEIQPTMTLSIN